MCRIQHGPDRRAIVRNPIAFCSKVLRQKKFPWRFRANLTVRTQTQDKREQNTPQPGAAWRAHHSRSPSSIKHPARLNPQPRSLRGQ